MLLDWNSIDVWECHVWEWDYSMATFVNGDYRLHTNLSPLILCP